MSRSSFSYTRTYGVISALCMIIPVIYHTCLIGHSRCSCCHTFKSAIRSHHLQCKLTSVTCHCGRSQDRGARLAAPLLLMLNFQQSRPGYLAKNKSMALLSSKSKWDGFMYIAAQRCIHAKTDRRCGVSSRHTWLSRRFKGLARNVVQSQA